MSIHSKNLKLFVILGIVLIGMIVFVFTRPHATQVQSENAQLEALHSFVDIANKSSGIESGAAFNYTFIDNGNPANFGIVKCSDEVRCDRVTKAKVARFQQSNRPSPDFAEVDVTTNKVVSLHRAVPDYDTGGNQSQEQIERTVRDFLSKVYPQFVNIEKSLTFEPGMKGTRLNNGNYFFRWVDKKSGLPEGLQTDVEPFVQVGITASGFIFSYDNTVDLYQNALTELRSSN